MDNQNTNNLNNIDSQQNSSPIQPQNDELLKPIVEYSQQIFNNQVVQQPVQQPVQPLNDVQPVIQSQVQVQPVVQPVQPAVQPQDVQPVQVQVQQPVEQSENPQNNNVLYTGQGSTITENKAATEMNSLNANLESNNSFSPNITTNYNNVDRNGDLFKDPALNISANGEVLAENQIVDSSNVGFVAAGSPLDKKKNPIIKYAVIGILLVVCGLLGYFYVYPFVVNTFFNKPKTVYTETIKSFTNNINSIIENKTHDKDIYDISLEFDSNIAELSDYVGYTYGFRYGYEPSKKNLEVGYSIKNDKVDYSNYVYRKGTDYYTKYSNYNDILYLDTEESINSNTLFSTIEELLKNKDILTSEEIIYINNKVSELFIETIDESKLSKEKTTIVINDKTYKGYKHIYSLNQDDCLEIKKHIYEGLKNDDNVIKYLSDAMGITLDETKNLFEINDEDKEEFELKISIITEGFKANVIGLQIEDNEGSSMHYYFNEGNFEFVSYTEYKDEDEIINTTSFEVIGINKGSYTDVTINYDKETIAKLNVKVWEDNKKEFDYTLFIKEDEENIKEYSGSIKYSKNVEDVKANYVLDFSLDVGDDDISLSINIDNYWKTDVANVNTNAAVTLSDYDKDVVKQNYINEVLKTPIKIFYNTIGGYTDSTVNDYLEEN